jgi:protein TonB
MLKRHWIQIVAAAGATALVAACSLAPGGRPDASPSPAPTASPAPAPWTSWTQPGRNIAARDPTLEQWKRQAAERIHAANSKQLFEGQPHHLLKGVIVADVTVDRSGRVTRSKIVRSPGIASLNNVVLASLKTASPLPAPPAALVKAGPITYSETWLFENDGRWRLRTLAMPQE